MFVATINTPGYLPDSDSPPPAFNTAQEAWAYLAEERQRAEDEVDYPSESPLSYEYSEEWATLTYLGSDEGLTSYGNPHADTLVEADGTGMVYAPTPGREEDEHDLGLCYAVTVVEDQPSEEQTRARLERTTLSPGTIVINEGPIDVESLGFIRSVIEANLSGDDIPEYRERLSEEMRLAQQPGHFTRMFHLADASRIERELDKGEHPADSKDA